MKRYIRESKYTIRNDQEVILDDVIRIEIDIDLSSYIQSSKEVVKFPGVEQFKQDACNVLENEYGFEVIEDVYDGKLQKGYISNRKDSVSVYFDTYFDVSKSEPAFKRFGVSSYQIPEAGLIYCFIHIRFSDHDLYDTGDTSHIHFLDKNTKKYVSRNPKVTDSIDEWSITTPESDMYSHYDEALDDLRYDLDVRIVNWVRRVKKHEGRKNSENS